MLRSGANDLGGTLMEETISRMAGSSYGSYRSVRTWSPSPRRRAARPGPHDAVRRGARGAAACRTASDGHLPELLPVLGG